MNKSPYPFIFLVGGTNAGGIAPVNNQRLAHRFQIVDELEVEEKELIIKVIDAMITKSKIESTINDFGIANTNI